MKPLQSEAKKERTASSGWGGDAGDGGFTRVGNKADVGGEAKEEESNGRKGRKGHFDNDGDDDIMIIPDLDDEGDVDEDITVQVAAAPKNTSRKVASLHELDSSIKSIEVRSGAAGIDLSLLSHRLVPVGNVQEVDERWEFDKLLQSVTQEFHRDKEMEGEREEKEGESKNERVTASGGTDRESRGVKVVMKGGEEESKTELNENDARQLDQMIGGGEGLKKKEGGRKRRGDM